MIGKKNKVNDADRDMPEDQISDGGDEPDRVPIEDVSQEQLDALLEERDRLHEERDRYLRAAADAENRVRTARKDVQEQYRQGVTAVARDIVTSLDHFDVALGQDMDVATVESIVAGVRSIRDELIRALARHGVGLIEPASGEELDPERHEAMMEQPNAGVEPGRIVAAVQVGYTLHDRVIRPAKVIVAGPAAQANDAEAGFDEPPASDSDS